MRAIASCVRLRSSEPTTVEISNIDETAALSCSMRLGGSPKIDLGIQGLVTASLQSLESKCR